MKRKLFASQLDDETINLVVRQHWIFLLTKLLIFVFLLLVPAVFMTIGPKYVPGLFEGQAQGFTNLIVYFYLFALLLSLLFVILFYYLNMQVITSRRIVDIDQKGLFNRTIAELNINKIEDVTSESKGFGATIFNYGWVYVQTAGTRERFEFENIPKPAEVERLILDLYSKFLQNNSELAEANNPLSPR